MKIDLTNIEVRPTISGKPQSCNFHKDVAELIYRNSRSLAETSFALKLFEGPVEASEQEVEYIKAVLPNFYYWAQDAILKSLNA